MSERPARPSVGFIAGLAAALLLASFADFLFYGAERAGAIIGAFALVWTGATMLVSPVLGRRVSAFAALLAIGFALLLVEDPGPLAWMLFWTALASAALLRHHGFDDALNWAKRLLVHIGYGALGPFGERHQLPALRFGPRFDLGQLVLALAFPVIGGTLFLVLFAAANPIIANLLGSIRVPDPVSAILHATLVITAFFAVWPALRPHRQPDPPETEREPVFHLPHPPALAITLSLLTFNALFAMQNALDLAFLWSGARLPGSMTLADYAHRGAYLLIATALLAGAFVLTMLRPGSESARRPLVKALVAL